MEIIEQHPFWKIIEWPFWIVSAIVVLYYIAKVCYLTYLFLKNGVFVGVVDLTSEKVKGWSKWRTILQILLPRTFSSRGHPGNIFESTADPIAELIHRDPSVLEQWANKNPSSLSQIVRDNQENFVSFTKCMACGKIARTHTTARE